MGTTAASGLSSGGCDPEEVEIEDDPGVCTDFQARTSVCLPFFEATTIVAENELRQPWSNLSNRRAVSSPVSLFICPSSPNQERFDRHHAFGAASTDYGAILQVDRGVYTDPLGVPDPGLAARHGVLAEYQASSPAAIVDGLSNTLAACKRGGGEASP